MKTYNSLLYLFTLVFTLAFTSCSDNDSDNPNGVDLIIGEWLFASENDYRCGTDEVVTERLRTDNESELIDVYMNDGTWYSLVGGELVTNGTGEGGTWTSKGENIYEIYFTSDDITQSIAIEFDGNNVMRYGINQECVEFAGENIYSYTVWNRQ